MKDPGTMTASELAAVVEKSPAIALEIVKAKPQEIARWKDGTARDAEAAFDWERFAESQEFFTQARKDGSYAAAMNARNARLASEAQAAAKIERDNALEAHLAKLDARDVERRRLEDEIEAKRLQGIPNPWKPAV